MTVILYSYSKRKNSTATPLPSTGKMVDCVLKDEISFINPVLRFDTSALLSGEFSPTAFNYVQIPYWQRFYFISDWRYLNGCWECSLNVDVLASFKDVIGDTESYIVRASSAYDGSIIDSFYPATTNVSIQKIQISSEIYHKSIPSGCYVIGIINNDTTLKVGAVTYYALNANQLSQLMAYLFSGSIYSASNIYEVGEGLFKSMFDPFQYIVSCVWFPFSANSMGTESKPIKVGYWDTGISGTVVRYVVTDPVGFKTALPIPTHPQANRGEYMNHAPYTRLTAYYPPFGEIPVDTTFIQYGSNNYLYGKMYIDYINGLANCYFSITNGYDPATADPYKYFTMRTSQIGVPIQLSQVMSDYTGMLSGIGGAVGSAITGSLGKAFTNIQSAIESAMPKVSSLGANGSFIEITEPPYLIVEHFRVVEENIAEFGRPLCATRKINTLSGYVKCGVADHSFNCTDQENSMINSFMQDGFYYE